jgi:PQQ-like domain
MRSSMGALLGVALAVMASTLGACSADRGDGDVEGSEQALSSNIHVLSSRNDTARTGLNPNEKVLSTENVNTASFGKVFSRPVDGAIFAQPLYVGGVNGKNIVYVATEHNTVYAFNADDKRATAAPLWEKNFGPSLPSVDTGCTLLAPEIGITATPVIDLATKTIWFTSRNKENDRVIHRLHALDIATGEPRPNSPVEITAKAPGTGTTSENGVITFDPLRQMQRPGLLKVGGRIYLGFASQCDITPYHGWLMSYDATTLEQKSVLTTTPNGGEGGIWNGGVGLNADEAGDIYFPAADVYPNKDATGPFNGANNLGNSLVRVKDTGNGFAVQTTFTPFDTRAFAPQDLSLGPTGGILIPGTQLYVAGDKRGQIFVVDRKNMGGSVEQDAQVVQKFQGTARGMWGGAAYYKQGAGGIYYLWGPGDRLKAYAFDGNQFQLPARVNTTTIAGYPGGALALSSDGETAGSGVLWTVRSTRKTAGLASLGGEGVVQAFDATDITHELWSSAERPTDAVGAIAKFAPPTVANGRVFVGTANNELVVYGLFGSNAPAPAGASNAPAPPAKTVGPAPTWTQVYDKFFGPGTPGHCSGVRGCHITIRAGFKCGQSKDECFAGLVAANLVTPANGTQSPIGLPGSPLSWLGGPMPLDNAVPNAAAEAAVTAWVAAGAKNN